MGNNGSWICMVVCLGVLAGMVLHVRPSADPVEMQANLRHAVPAVFYRPASASLFGEDQER